MEVSLSHVSNTLPENRRSPNSEAETFTTDCSGRFAFPLSFLHPESAGEVRRWAQANASHCGSVSQLRKAGLRKSLILYKDQ